MSFENPSDFKKWPHPDAKLFDNSIIKGLRETVKRLDDGKHPYDLMKYQNYLRVITNLRKENLKLRKENKRLKGLSR